MFPVIFGNPLLVKKNTRYTIRLSMYGPKTFTGKSYKESVVLKTITLDLINIKLNGRN
jgi:hypothetical protein